MLELSHPVGGGAQLLAQVVALALERVQALLTILDGLEPRLLGREGLLARGAQAALGFREAALGLAPGAGERVEVALEGLELRARGGGLGAGVGGAAGLGLLGELRPAGAALGQHRPVGSGLGLVPRLLVGRPRHARERAGGFEGEAGLGDVEQHGGDREGGAPGVGRVRRRARHVRARHRGEAVGAHAVVDLEHRRDPCRRRGSLPAAGEPQQRLVAGAGSDRDRGHLHPVRGRAHATAEARLGHQANLSPGADAGQDSSRPPSGRRR